MFEYVHLIGIIQKSKTKIFAFIRFAYSSKKLTQGMRSALKDTMQRNKSLLGFLKCTACVKFVLRQVKCLRA